MGKCIVCKKKVRKFAFEDIVLFCVFIFAAVFVLGAFIGMSTVGPDVCKGQGFDSGRTKTVDVWNDDSFEYEGVVVIECFDKVAKVKHPRRTNVQRLSLK